MNVNFNEVYESIKQQCRVQIDCGHNRRIGKTRWLSEIAKELVAQNHTVFYFSTQSFHEYRIEGVQYFKKYQSENIDRIIRGQENLKIIADEIYIDPWKISYKGIELVAGCYNHSVERNYPRFNDLDNFMRKWEKEEKLRHLELIKNKMRFISEANYSVS